MNKLFTNQTIDLEGNWYAPEHYLKDEVDGVITAEYINQSSSAGDWDGFFMQEIGGKYYVISFSQENNWPSEGFTLHTGDVVLEYDEKPDNEQVINEIAEAWEFGLYI